MDAGADERAPTRPWLAHYPEGIAWDAPLDPTPVHERVLATADRMGSASALDFFGAKTSYAELGRQIRAFAGALQKKLGVTKGARVALLLPNTPFYPIAYYAVLLAGGTIVNCNPLYSADEIAHVIDDAGADVLVTTDLAQVFSKAEAVAVRCRIAQVVVCRFASALPLLKGILFSLARRSDLARPDRSGIGARVAWFHKLIGEGHAFEPIAIDADRDVAVQQYTGGTTGVPKGAMLSHANVTANLAQIDLWAFDQFHPPNKVVAVLPFFHVFAMTACLNVPLANGAEVVMLPRFSLKDLMALIRRTRPTVLPAVPTLLQAMAASSETTPEMLSSLEIVVSGGAPLTPEIRRRFARVSHARLAEGYGLTECAPVVCCEALLTPGKPQSIGLPLPGTDLRFLDVEDPAKVLPYGQRGELAVKGPQVMLGYFGAEEATRHAFSDGYLRTGDVGYMDEEGYVFLVDRIKDLIISSGFNIYPRNIEEALERHPDVEECNVIGVKDDYRGEVPIAFVKRREGAEITEGALREYLAAHVAKVEVPREIHFRSELPRTLVGKLSKKELREEYAALQAKKGGN
jgi:long-chain acyl-CoA synthetase